MNKRLLLGSLAALGALSSVTATEKKPNIIFILADDLGIGDVSTYNPGGKIRTSHLDQMASEGVCFTDAHSSSSVSTPTRYGILTGRYNWRSTLKEGVLFGYDKPFIKPDRSTIATVLKRGGYLPASANGIWAGTGIIWKPAKTRLIFPSRLPVDRPKEALIISMVLLVRWIWIHTCMWKIINLRPCRIG